MLILSLERGGFLIKVKMPDRNHFRTRPSGLYREVVLLQGGLFRQDSLCTKMICITASGLSLLKEHSVIKAVLSRTF